MLKISRDQLRALEASMDMAGPVASWLKNKRPKPFGVIPAPQLAHMARTLCTRAAALGIQDRRTVMLFAGYAADIAPDFDRHASVRKALAKSEPDAVLRALPSTIGPEVWTDIRGAASSIGWRLEAPLWDEAPPLRIGVAVTATLDSAELKPVQPLVGLAAHAAKEGGPCAQTEDGLYVCSVFAALQSDAGRLQSILRASLARTRDIRAAIASLRLRLLLEHEVWV